jgi:hypothetical protein
MGFLMTVVAVGSSMIMMLLWTMLSMLVRLMLSISPGLCYL